MTKRSITGLVILALSSVISIQTAFAESPYISPNVYYSVIANSNGARPDAYVNMYVVTPVSDGVYTGKLVSTKKQLYGTGKFPTFKITPGRMVDFIAFSSKQEAMATKTWTFTVPPFKNFANGYYNTLCRINKLDQYSVYNNDRINNCGQGTTIGFSDNYVAFEDNQSYRPKTSFAVLEAWPMETGNPLSVVKNAEVQLYNEYGMRVSPVMNTGERGIVTFIVQRGGRYYVDAVKDGRSFKGPMTAYAQNTPAVFYIAKNGKSMTNTATGARTSVMRLNLYPNGTNYTPVPTTPATVTLNQPTITNPISNALLSGQYPQRVYFTWTPVSMATGYDIDFDIACANCAGGWTNFQNDTTGNTPAYTSKPMYDNNQYRVAVRARRDVAGASTVWSNWSSYIYFSYNSNGNVTPVSLTTPVITSPIQNAQITNDGTPTTRFIAWTPVSGADYYDVNLESYCSNCAGWSIIQSTTITTGVPNFTTATLTANTQYRFKVRARSTNGIYSDYSNYVYFTFGNYNAPVTLATPVTNSPAPNMFVVNDGTPKRLNIGWNAISGATSYELDVDALCSNCATWADVQTQSGIISTNWTTDILAYKEYRYRVRALGPNGATSPWSSYGYFTYGEYTPINVAPAVPVITSPTQNLFIANAGTAKNIQINWNQVAGALRYDVDIDVLCSICVSWRDFQTETVTGLTNATTAALDGDSQYRVRVRSVNGSGMASSWSAYTYFTYGAPIPAGVSAPTIITPAQNAVLSNFPNSVALSFTAVAGAKQYQYEIVCTNCEADPNQTKSYGITSTNSTNATTIELPRGKAFYVQVRTVTNDQISAWSALRYFTTAPLAN